MTGEPNERLRPDTTAIRVTMLTGEAAARSRADRDALDIRVEETRARFRETGTVPGLDASVLAAVAAASERIGRDLRRTTSRRLELAPFEADGDTVICIWIDDTRHGWFGCGFGPGEADDVEYAVACIAGQAREHTLDEEIWGGWPICSRHGGHPLEPVVSKGQAVWGCIADGSVVAQIGDLQTIG